MKSTRATRTAAVLVLALGALVLAGGMIGAANGVRGGSDEFPVLQTTLMLLALVGMHRAELHLRKTQKQYPKPYRARRGSERAR